MQITNLQTGDSFDVIGTTFSNGMVHIKTTINGKDFVITLNTEDYHNLWQ